ncbi:PilZ domain-containing protein [uncultured Azohydromonas sp.]|jgi:Predicted glycosyltransferase|uniref:PilZ domain-containing protein n=1 Tax=uncultured Azohydromonas sp. TaxID=487342 RepID=UPI00263A2ADA|nr:PilZ domain-containing protein [uncultured Azohydromonas sp.]
MPVRHQQPAGSSNTALRRHVRERFATTVQLTLSDQRVLRGRTLDISLGGMQLVLPESLPLHGECALSLTIPAIPMGAKVITARAQVTSIVCSGRVHGFLAGLRFTTFPSASRAALLRYLQARDIHRHPQPGRPRNRADDAGHGHDGLAASDPLIRKH